MQQELSVSIYSFSYKNQIPKDKSPHGGGFIFDCRSLPNPGREKEYADKTGLDIEVIEYLEKCKEVEAFKEHSFALVEGAVKNYLERQFSSLMVCYGCTGGQHRSVYFASQLAGYLGKYDDVDVVVQHCEF